VGGLAAEARVPAERRRLSMFVNPKPVLAEGVVVAVGVWTEPMTAGRLRRWWLLFGGTKPGDGG
jgi:hypothetical protein